MRRWGSGIGGVFRRKGGGQLRELGVLTMEERCAGFVEDDDVLDG